jgi:hypothetical protein
LQIPQIETNKDVDVISGSIAVAVNSALTWTFDIPPQKQKFGVITGQQVTNANKISSKILPITLKDWQGTNPKEYFFDGK